MLTFLQGMKKNDPAVRNQGQMQLTTAKFANEPQAVNIWTASKVSFQSSET